MGSLRQACKEWTVKVKRVERSVGKLTLIVQHDCQDRDVISLRNPVNAARNREEERAIADNLADEFLLALVVSGELNP
jgi:ribosomal protein S7